MSGLRQWQMDGNLAPIRDVVELDKLRGPEQFNWQRFWADAATLGRRAEADLIFF